MNGSSYSPESAAPSLSGSVAIMLEIQAKEAIIAMRQSSGVRFPEVHWVKAYLLKRRRSRGKTAPYFSEPKRII
jgi:hypothetical protein